MEEAGSLSTKTAYISKLYGVPCKLKSELLIVSIPVEASIVKIAVSAVVDVPVSITVYSRSQSVY